MSDKPKSDPSTNAKPNGRTPAGRFAKGNPGGPGNPFASQVGKHRAAFFAAIKAKDVVAALDVIRQTMRDEDARPADRLAAASELLDRVIGKPAPADLLERIEGIEKLLEGKRNG